MRRASAMVCSLVILIAMSCGEQRGALDPPSSAGTGGSFPAPQGEAGGGGVPDSGGGAGALGGGEGGMGNSPEPEACTYHVAAVAEENAGGAGGEGSEGGAGGSATEPEFDVTVVTNGFVGNYLADGAGRALYLFGADRPGDCEYEPVSNCFADCALSWPIFDAGARRLGPGLDDAAFGTIERSDGVRQTTYLGWPLYYYRKDMAPGDVLGQAVGKIWHLAETVLPNVVVMRIETTRVLADGRGRVLYVHAADTAGSAERPPLSACVGACARDYPPFWLPAVAAVSYLEPHDFSAFSREDGLLQLAYRGSPLYVAESDERAGEMSGVNEQGWTVASP
jgi:predicted lipoprotein with Yx(FWY)xxD motif